MTSGHPKRKGGEVGEREKKDLKGMWYVMGIGEKIKGKWK